MIAQADDITAGSISMRLLQYCLITVLCLCGWVEAGQVENVRVWDGPDSTRVVLDLDRTVDYRLFTLDDPARVVIDIADTRVGSQLTLQAGSSDRLGGVRHAVRNGSDARVVLDLEDKFRPKSFLLEPAGQYGHRLVIDLYPEDAQSPTGSGVARASQDGERDMVVAIDAGHGGEDPGAIGPGGTHEKRVTLALARELAEVINARQGMRAVLIRTGDYYVPLAERYDRARKAQADLFISLHADAFRDFRVRGSSVYVLSRSGASSEAARLLAKNENKADLVGGVKLDRGDDMLSSVLLDLSQSAALEYSDNAAGKIIDELGTVGKRHRQRVERANFVVLRSPDVPSVLVEVGFISNPDDEKNLNSDWYRRKAARAIASGVDAHFRETAPQGTWFASHRTPERHVVEHGDTLGVIAQKYQVSINQLRQVNNLDGDVIHPGAVLVIPAGS